MFNRKAILEWALAAVIVIAALVCWRIASTPQKAQAGAPSNPCNSSSPTD